MSYVPLKFLTFNGEKYVLDLIAEMQIFLLIRLVQKTKANRILRVLKKIPKFFFVVCLCRVFRKWSSHCSYDVRILRIKLKGHSRIRWDKIMLIWFKCQLIPLCYIILSHLKEKWHIDLDHFLMCVKPESPFCCHRGRHLQANASV